MIAKLSLNVAAAALRICEYIHNNLWIQQTHRFYLITTQQKLALAKCRQRVQAVVFNTIESSGIHRFQTR